MFSFFEWFADKFIWIQIASILVSLILIIGIIRLIIKIDYFSDKREYGLEIWKLEKLQKEKFKKVWQKVLNLIIQPDPKKWKEAVFLSDDFFDEILKASGYIGSSKEERLSQVPKEKVSNIDQLIKIQKEILQLRLDENSVLDHEKAKEYLRIYRKAFYQLGYLD
jgi:hypothetical protein